MTPPRDVVLDGIVVAAATVERFLAKIDTSGGEDACWPWTGAVKKDGYAGFRLTPRTAGNKIRAAHRVAYMLLVGPIPADYVVDHACHDPELCRLGPECPHRRCMNPRHLKAITSDENVARGAACVRPLVPLPAVGPAPAAGPAKLPARVVRRGEVRRMQIGEAGLVELAVDLRWLDLPCEEAQRLRDAVLRFEAECAAIGERVAAGSGRPAWQRRLHAQQADRLTRKDESA